MKYKIGQKVEIKHFTRYSEKTKKLLEKTNHILIIKIVMEDYYIMEEVEGSYIWSDYDILDSIPEPTPITTRFEILDL